MADIPFAETEVVEETFPIPDIDVGKDPIPTPDIPRFDPDIPPIPIPVLAEKEFTVPEFDTPIPNIQETKHLVFLPELPSIPYIEDFSLGLDVETERFDLLGFDELVELPVSVELKEPDIEDDLAVFDFPRVLEIPVLEFGPGNETIGGFDVPYTGIEIEETPLPFPGFGPIPIPDIPFPDISVDRDGNSVDIPVDVRIEPKLTEKELADLLPVSIPQGFQEDPLGFVFTAVVEEVRKRIGDGFVGTLKGLTNDILEEVLTQETKERIRDRANR